MTISKVIIVGSGPAGIGVASLLEQAGINYVVLEKNEIGNSFLQWPESMEMITPSFPSNAFGQIDLNSICENSSPAFSFNKEHLNGEEYSEYLDMVSEHFNLNIQTQTEVKTVKKQKDGWLLNTSYDMKRTHFTSMQLWQIHLSEGWGHLNLGENYQISEESNFFDNEQTSNEKPYVGLKAGDKIPLIIENTDGTNGCN